MQRIDHTGEKYGHLLIEEMIFGKTSGGNSKTYCKCLCDCGNEVVKAFSNLTRNKIVPPHCGCKKDESKNKVAERCRKTDLIGQKVGHLTVLEMLYNYNGSGSTYCRCRCDCGNECIKPAKYLKNTHKTPQHCGCMDEYYRAKLGEMQSMRRRKDLTGMRFGRLVVLEMIYEKGEKADARCLCDCGKEIVTKACSLTGGNTKSCGCYQAERDLRIPRVDSSGYISESGVKIIAPTRRNKQGAWIYDCECRCGKHFESIPAFIKSGIIVGCGCKAMSTLEQRTAFILDDLNLSYEQQKSFPDCKYKNVLKFDFYLSEYNLLVECQGEQHYKPVEKFGGEDGFKERVIRDNIKRDYCDSNNYTLLEIPYYYKDIEIKDTISNAIYP